MAEEKKTANNFEGFRNICIGIAALLIPIVGHMFTNQIKTREINAEYTNIATRILLEPPAKQGGIGANRAIRKWATDVLAEKGGVEIKGEALRVLINATMYGYSHWGESTISLRQAQHILKDKYDYTGPIDGKDSIEFRNSITRFQKDKNLEEDGIMGPKTATQIKASATEQPSIAPE
ncbi:MAG: peptidoglycan-binding domain-containing protein [Akkermansiaceae bacterium]